MILVESGDPGFAYSLCFVARLLDMVVIPLLLCTSLKLELRNIRSLLSNCYHCKSEASLLKCKLDKWMGPNTTMDFDCGFFEIDVGLCAVVVDFVSLFVFAILN